MKWMQNHCLEFQHQTTGYSRKNTGCHTSIVNVPSMRWKKILKFCLAIGLSVALSWLNVLSISMADEELDHESFYAGLEQISIWWPAIKVADAHDGHHVLIIWLEDNFFDATDTSCQLFWHMMKHITRNNWIVYIAGNNWIPSSSRLINRQMAERMLKP